MKKISKAMAWILTIALMVGLLPAGAYAAQSEMTLKVGEVSGAAGSEVQVHLDLENNPGVASIAVSIAYDSNILTLKSIEYNSELGGIQQQPASLDSPVGLRWVNGTANFTQESARFATLTFSISKSVSNNAVAYLNVNFDPDEICDTDLTNIPLTVINGSVTVHPCKPGDINEDGKVNNKDVLLLMQHLANWDVVVNKVALDTSGDGKVNNKDVLLLMQYLAGWDVIIHPVIVQECDHTMEAIAFKAATCTESGNIAYWHCTSCEKYFGDEYGNSEISLESTALAAPGHTVVVDSAVAPTETTTGLTEGSHCSVCGLVLVKQEIIPVLEVDSRTISYNIANGDPYIASLNVTNSNPTSLSVTKSLTLKNLSVDGYRFLGWYDLPSGSNAEIVKKLEPGEDDVELYAHWEKIEYTVQFKSSLYPIDSVTYTVDKGAVLPTPSLSNYVFAGWSDEDGHLYSKTVIPSGTIGNITLTANWTSERNKAVTKTKLDDPIIYEDEDNKVIYFAYEIGKIENVPLYTIHDFGYISGDGVTKTETETYTTTITETTMQAYAIAMANATTKSSNWTLSSGWSDSTSANTEWLQENGYTEDDIITIGKSEEGNWNVSSSSGGSTDTTRLDTTQDNWQNEIKIDSSKESTKGGKLALGIDSSLKASGFGIDAELSGSIDREVTQSETSKFGIAFGGKDEKTTIGTDSTTTTSNWNTNSSYGGSSTSSSNYTASRAISELISQKTGYGSQYIQNEDYSHTQGYSSTITGNKEYSVSTTYSKVTSKEHTSTWTTQATKPGYHRWVVAGTAHVFAVVGYNIAQKSYFVSTYSIMDDATHEFEDYSYTTASYNDNQNGVIPFEVPYEVAEYVSERICASGGLKIDSTTGVVTEYSGTDNCVVIPEWYVSESGDVIKVTGISSTAFQNNKDIVAVVLSDFITEIPDNAFAGCTSLVGLLGGTVKSIGDNAFKGCTSIVECGVTYNVESLGSTAFEGVGKLVVNPVNIAVAKAATRSGAKQIIIHANSLKGDTGRDEEKILTVPDGTAYFELNGYENTFRDFAIVSNADKTVINKANFVSNEHAPLKISSPELILNQVTVNAPGIALLLTAEKCNIGLQGTVKASSVLCRNIKLYESNTDIVGKLSVDGQMRVCSTIEGTSLLDCSNVEFIDDEAKFDAMTKAYTVSFDANGGSTVTTTKTLTNGQPFGELPSTTREHYSFLGWYTAKTGGDRVTDDTIFTGMEDITLYAHWELNAFTIKFNGNGGKASSESMGVVYNTAVGTLPTATRTGFTFAGWYTAATGGTKYTKDTIFKETKDITLYAHWTVNSYTASWSSGTGYTITVKRTSSPNGGAATGTLSSGAKVYYGDVLSVTYAAATGYSISKKGATSITVAGNITSSNIYAAATANSYTYSIVYQSSNGTSLGSSSATYKFGTTNTISAPSKPGYTTPKSQSVKWDATSKTIKFVYAPAAVSNAVKTGTISTLPQITYSAKVQYQNRTANSVQLRVEWTATIHSNGYTYYGQNFKAYVGSVSTGTVTVVPWGEWQTSSTTKSATATSDWITVPLSTTNATTVPLEVYYWQVNWSGDNMSGSSDPGPDMYDKWSIAVPAF